MVVDGVVFSHGFLKAKLQGIPNPTNSGGVTETEGVVEGLLDQGGGDGGKESYGATKPNGGTAPVKLDVDTEPAAAAALAVVAESAGAGSDSSDSDDLVE